MKSLTADITPKTCYLKFRNKAIIEYERLVRKANRISIAKENCYNYLTARKGSIAKDLNIDLDNYYEFNNQVYNTSCELESFVIKLLKKNTKGERQDIIELAKWCSILKNEHKTFKELKLCKTKSELTFDEYKKYLFDYYCEVHKIILEGKSYKFGHGIGSIRFRKFIFNENYRSIDFDATRKRKQEIIANGKKPYNKLEAINAKAEGKEYDGIPYIVYKSNNYGYSLKIENSLIIRDSLPYDFKPVSYINAKYRGYNYNQIIERFCRTEDDINYLQLDVRTKLALLLIMNPGKSLNFKTK